MNVSLIRKLATTSFILAVIPCLLSCAASVPSRMTGKWEGTTQVIVTWCERKELFISLDINADGAVAGTVGDAELVDARLDKKQSWFGGKDSKKTTHLVIGTLRGAIVAGEEISRDKVFIHLRLDDGKILGGLATSGSKIGGKDSMILTATSLRLAGVE